MVKTTKNCQKLSKMPQIPFWCAHIIKIIGNYVWNKFWDVSDQKVLIKKIFVFRLKNHDFSKKILKKSKNGLFDLWDPVWWVPHMVLGLNHWFRPENKGSEKSVPQICKSALTLVLNATEQRILENSENAKKSAGQPCCSRNGRSRSTGWWRA